MNRPMPRHIPLLHEFHTPPEEYARTTCFTAGHLVTKNAGWRNIRPVLNADACTGCLQCYLYCPDGTIYKVAPQTEQGGAAAAAPAAPIAIDYDFCKGCGICAKMCKFGAIEMVSEADALAEEARVRADRQEGATR